MHPGGLAHMSYPINTAASTATFPMANPLGMPGHGFAARRAQAPQIKRLSFEPALAAHRGDVGAPTPRTSRSHLLAGLRTAPKSPGPVPATAPPTQQQFTTGRGLSASIYAADAPPPAASRSGSLDQHALYAQAPLFPGAEQILAPPDLRLDDPAQEQMDPQIYAQLVATNMYLAEQQQRLQQQLRSVQAAAHQMQGLNMNASMGFATPPVTPQNMHMFQQQQQQQQQQAVKSHMQPIITPVAGAQPGLYSYYNPMTGQQTYFVDGQAAYPAAYGNLAHHSPPPQPGTPRFQVSPPPNDDALASMSPPRKSISPAMDVAPLPPPSAGAFRRGHRKAESMAPGVESPRPLGTPKVTGVAAAGTPVASGFAPGQGRAGEHPVRQPRGPPSLDELKAKPTTHCEGSKNFATRTRRSAVHNLVRAGLERRRHDGSRSGSMSPVSAHGDRPLSSEDECSDSGRSGSGSLSGRPSIGSSRTSAHGAIGSDRPSRTHSFERTSSMSIDSTFSQASLGSGSDEAKLVAGSSFAAIFKNGGKKTGDEVTEKKKAPMLVLTSSEKRKNSGL